MGEKIQKVLARSGIASRREIERWLTQGRIEVNDEPAHLGQRLALTDEVTVDGQPVSLQSAEQSARQVLLYHKPLGEVCSRRDQQQRPTIFDKLPALPSGRWISVGRLDINSSGLILLTTDGELAHRLMHPSYEIFRTYQVRIDGQATEQELEQLRQGVELDDGPARCQKVSRQGKAEGRNSWYELVLQEGRNREVRRLWQALGYRVNRLIRTRYGNCSLPDTCRPGQFCLLSTTQLQQLCAAVQLK